MTLGTLVGSGREVVAQGASSPHTADENVAQPSSQLTQGCLTLPSNE